MYRLDYCISLLVGLIDCDVTRLQSVQNIAGHFFGLVSRSVEHLLCDKFHWLVILQRIKFKVEVLDTRLSRELRFPTWRNFLFLFRQFLHWVNQNRSAVHVNFIIPSTTRNITCYQKCFAVAENTLWNLLPLEILSSSSLKMFHSGLKMYILREAYNISAPNLPF